MTASPTTDPGQPGGSSFSNREPLAWIDTVVHQLVQEAGLVRTADIEDLVIIVYVGLLDDPDPAAVTHDHLLSRCRQQLVVWAWEQGNADEPMHTTAR